VEICGDKWDFSPFTGLPSLPRLQVSLGRPVYRLVSLAYSMLSQSSPRLFSLLLSISLSPFSIDNSFLYRIIFSLGEFFLVGIFFPLDYFFTRVIFLIEKKNWAGIFLWRSKKKTDLFSDSDL
jgi:hypothetical protein